MPDTIIQAPAPGSRMVFFRGDTLTFTLTLPRSLSGKAWLRTTIGQGKATRNEIIREAKHNDTPLGTAWFDIPMKKSGNNTFKVTVGLNQVGHFEGKCFFLPEGSPDPIWSEGENTAINVEPAGSCCANIIYNAFVRQFGPGKAGKSDLGAGEQAKIRALDEKGYTVIPPSGTFRDLIAELDFILDELGCRIIMLLPINPTPTTYGRMGRFGSPYASLGFTAVDPALARFDPAATPLEQFIELADAIHFKDARLFIDIAVNHTGWAAGLHETHPQWLVRNNEGQIEMPGAWGVTWADLTRLDFTDRELWYYIAEVFLTWCRRGVDGFRCDAGYMIPIAAWKYIIACVRDQFPDTIFLLEGLGGKISVTRDLLNVANFNWAYSELFQNYDRLQIETYLREANDISKSDGITVHFAETHDNNRLAATSKRYAKMRTALCALLSHQGGFGFANGVEWFAAEKIMVHEANSLNWGAEPNQVEHIKKINQLLKSHPAFHDRVELKTVQRGEGNFIAVVRCHMTLELWVLVLANLDTKNITTASWDKHSVGMKNEVDLYDLLTEEKVFVEDFGETCCLPLAPGQVRCLSSEPFLSTPDLSIEKKPQPAPSRVLMQKLAAKALDVYCVFHGVGSINGFDPMEAGQQLADDPMDFCRRHNTKSDESRVISFQWPMDLKREVMIPGGHFLMIRAGGPFRAAIMEDGRVVAREESLPDSKGNYFSLFTPIAPPLSMKPYTLALSMFSKEGCRHDQAKIRILPDPGKVNVKQMLSRSECLNPRYMFLDTNGRGGMLRAHIDWGHLSSRYDALLAANLDHQAPEDRWIMLTRYRAWMVFQGYSQPIRNDVTKSFSLDDPWGGSWHVKVPAGQGEHVDLTLSLQMVLEENTVQLRIHRHGSLNSPGLLNDAKPVRIILRPDIEDRNFHDTTKAYQGPEDAWPKAIAPSGSGFSFTPSPHRALLVETSIGGFIHEPEWHYMVYRSLDGERGLDPHSDLFSPGYFSIELSGETEAILTAKVKTEQVRSHEKKKGGDLMPGGNFRNNNRSSLSFPDALEKAMDQFIVRRGSEHTVIAGYPWFLDWGRDTLIFLRGLIQTQRSDLVLSILKQFAMFEKRGTIPNMIRGNDTDNRDTSDAPLWLFAVCRDVLANEKSDAFLDEICGQRSLRRILVSMAHSLMSGTENSIRMDDLSGLLFSPAHFTWMDTNHPAGTPRQGYPIEIQALWHNALLLLDKIDHDQGKTPWAALAKQVKHSIVALFKYEKGGYLFDCIHADYNMPAKDGKKDDALRPNQLFALTMGVVEDQALCRSILYNCEKLILPGAVRSLADQPVKHPLEIIHDGIWLNDPHHPYKGVYTGNEDRERKPAYHNGTAWTWLFPSFCEAWFKVYGEQGKYTALSFLESSVDLLNTGCLGHMPEILDGDNPHCQKGCDAQAWGVSEVYRVWKLLSR